MWCRRQLRGIFSTSTTHPWLLSFPTNSLTLRALHTTRPCLAQRLENEEIPFKSAVLVIIPGRDNLAGGRQVPKEEQPPPAPTPAPVRRFPAPPAPKVDPHRLFTPTPTQVKQHGQRIDVATYLRTRLDRMAEVMQLVRSSPTPIVILAPRLPGDLNTKREGKKIGWEYAWLKIGKGQQLPEGVEAVLGRGLDEAEPQQQGGADPVEDKTPKAGLREIHVPTVLGLLDKKHWKLELTTERPRATVQLVDRAVERAQRDDGGAKKKKAGPAGRKEFQFSWSVAPGDVKHKLNAVRKELGKGCRCDLVWAPKDVKTQAPPADVMQARLHEIVAELEDVAREYKVQEVIRSRGVGIVYLEAK